MIVAAIDTGMRQGEMLALRFSDVDLERGLITLRGETTKSRKTRVVPISTERLRAVIEWLRLDADGDEKAEDVLVFSNDASEPLRLFHRTWVSLVLRAHGLTPAGGTTCGTSTPHGWSSMACRWPRCATSSATPRSRRPSATTTRRSRTSRSPPPSSNADTHPRHPRAQSFKILSRSQAPVRCQTHHGQCLRARLTRCGT
jgi:integrase